MIALALRPPVAPPKTAVAVRPSVISGPSREGTLAARFCGEHACAPDRFVPLMLRRCLARRALPVLWLRGGAELFRADRALLQAVAQAVDQVEVLAAIDDFWGHQANYAWLRRVAGLRISTLRLRQVAGAYLPPGVPRGAGRAR